MGTIQMNPRSVKKTIRFREEEWKQIQTAMDTDGYLSVSRYIRDIILRGRLTVKRDVKITDHALRKQINDVTTQIAKIGANYNQFVARYNSMCNARTKDGRPVVSTRATIHHVSSLENKTDQLIEMVHLLIEATKKTDLLASNK